MTNIGNNNVINNVIIIGNMWAIPIVLIISGVKNFKNRKSNILSKNVKYTENKTRFNIFSYFTNSKNPLVPMINNVLSNNPKIV